jgi:hypothetical protein
MEDRWDCVSVVCIKPIEGLRVGSNYRVNGRGNLDYNGATDKKGWGVCLKDEWVGVFDEEGNVIKNSWKIPYEKRTRFVYVTLEELEKHFISDEESYIIYQRDNKLNELGI